MKHTKGNWRIEGTNWTTSISNQAKEIAVLKFFDCGTGDPRSINKEEFEANIRLISAAPELIEATTKIKAWLKENNIKTPHDSLISSAIKKAIKNYIPQ